MKKKSAIFFQREEDWKRERPVKYSSTKKERTKKYSERITRKKPSDRHDRLFVGALLVGRVLPVRVAFVLITVVPVEFVELFFGVEARETAPQRHHQQQDKGEAQRRVRGLDGDQDQEAEELDAGEGVHLPGAHLPDVTEIVVVLGGPEEELDAVHELHAAHRAQPEVHEDAKDDSLRDETECGRRENHSDT